MKLCRLLSEIFYRLDVCLGISGEGELRGQPAKPSSPRKIAIKMECGMPIPVIQPTVSKQCPLPRDKLLCV